MKKIICFSIFFFSVFTIKAQNKPFNINSKIESVESWVKYNKYFPKTETPKNISIKCVAYFYDTYKEIYLVIVKENDTIIEYSEVDVSTSNFTQIPILKINKDWNLENFIQNKNYKKHEY